MTFRKGDKVALNSDIKFRDNRTWSGYEHLIRGTIASDQEEDNWGVVVVLEKAPPSWTASVQEVVLPPEMLHMIEDEWHPKAGETYEYKIISIWKHEVEGYDPETETVFARTWQDGELAFEGSINRFSKITWKDWKKDSEKFSKPKPADRVVVAPIWNDQYRHSSFSPWHILNAEGLAAEVKVTVSNGEITAEVIRNG